MSSRERRGGVTLAWSTKLRRFGALVLALPHGDSKVQDLVFTHHGGTPIMQQMKNSKPDAPTREVGEA
jgi:hypothetical protein